MLHEDLSREQLEILEGKGELEMNYFVLEQLGEFIKNHVDPRIALIIEAVLEKGKKITNMFYTNIKKMDELNLKINAIFKEKEEIILQKEDLRFKVHVLTEELAKKKQEMTSELNLLKVKNEKEENVKNLKNLSNNKDVKNRNDVLKKLKYNSISKQTLLDTIDLESSTRYFSIAQTKSIIQDLVKTKIKKDNNFLLAGLPFATMKEHLNNFAHKKFGIKKLISEFKSAFYKSLKTYSSQECDVYIFLNVLENKLSEDFNKNVEIVQKVLLESFFALFNEKYKVLKEEIINIDIFQNDGLEIIKVLYSPMDVKEIEYRLDRIPVKETEKMDNYRKKKPVSEFILKTIKFDFFLNVVLKYICESQVEFLTPLSALFMEFDKDNEGKLNEAQFQQFIEKVSQMSNLNLDFEDFALRLDPSKTGVFTYSSIVSFISMYFQSEETGGRSVLDLINEKR